MKEKELIFAIKIAHGKSIALGMTAITIAQGMQLNDTLKKIKDKGMVGVEVCTVDYTFNAGYKLILTCKIDDVKNGQIRFTYPLHSIEFEKASKIFKNSNKLADVQNGEEAILFIKRVTDIYDSPFIEIIDAE